MLRNLLVFIAISNVIVFITGTVSNFLADNYVVLFSKVKFTNAMGGTT